MPPAVLAERLTTTHPDVLRELLLTFIHTLMGAEADALCGAEYHMSARHTKTGSELLRSTGSPIAKHDLGTILGPQLGRIGAGQRP